MISILNTSAHRTRARDKAVVLMLLATGLRLNELRELRLADVHIDRPIESSYLVVRAETSKSKDSRKVRIDRLAATAVDKYSKDWRPNRHSDGPLFLTEEGEPFSLSGFQTYMGRLGDRFEAAGIPNWMAIAHATTGPPALIAPA
jgi:site-specific recombinase XerD